MKTVDLFFKKVEVTDYYSQLDEVKVRILFNDGTDKALIKQISIKEPQKQVREMLSEIRSKLKDKHKNSDSDDDPLSGALIIRFKQDTDVLEEKMSRFLMQVKERIHSGKLAKLSYYDLEKKIKGVALSLE